MKKDKTIWLVLFSIAALICVGILLFHQAPTPVESPTISAEPTPADPQITPPPSSAFIQGAGWDIKSDTSEAGDASHSYETPSAEVAYRNDKEYSIVCDLDGNMITVSNGNATDVTDAVILNFQMSDETRKVGYYIHSTRNALHYPADAQWSDLYSEQNKDHSNFVINLMHNELIPIEGNTISWSNDLLYDGKSQTGTTLYVRALDLTAGGQLITGFKVEIRFVDGAYQLWGVESTDVFSTGELSDEDRELLLLNAYSLAQNQVLNLDGSLVADMANVTVDDILERGYVEYLGNRMYFPTSISPAGRAVLSSTFINLYQDIYAVSIPTSQCGVFTLYYAPNVGSELPDRIAEAVTAQYGEDIPEDLILPELEPITDRELQFFAMDPYDMSSRSANFPSGYLR